MYKYQRESCQGSRNLLGYRFFNMSFPPDLMYILLDGIALGIKSIFIIKTFPYSLI